MRISREMEALAAARMAADNRVKKYKCKYPVVLKVTNANGYAPRNLRMAYETGDVVEVKIKSPIVDICSDGYHSEVSEEVFEIYFEALPDQRED